MTEIVSGTPASGSVVGALRKTEAASVVIALVGSGGDGVALLGDLLLRIAARQGLYGMTVQSYGPQIRGGESASLLRLSTEEIQYEGDSTDLLLCFRTSDIARFRGSVKLHEHSIVLLEATDQGTLPEWAGRSAREPYRFALSTFENGQEVAGPPKNMLALGLMCRTLGWPEDYAREALTERFGHRPTLLAQDLAALETGYAAAGVPTLPALAARGHGLIVESGNEAVARGAMDAGIRFFAGYPITPSSEIMETLIEELPTRGGRVVQAEDEIAALGMVVGASFGGVPSMTATSGPGLSLMTEMTGLASMAEIPIVVVDCQRAGPATGMPSRTEQSDLFHAVFGGHGDFPRVVLGVFDVVHAREVMFRAVGLAERYQLPVLVLSDAYIAQRRQIRDPLTAMAPPPLREVWRNKDGPVRFALTAEHGVNAFRVPGTGGGTYLAAGIEHTPEGMPTSDGAMHQKMNDKRFQKLRAIAADTRDWYRALGAPGAPRGLVAWGSQYGLMREWAALRPDYRVFLPEVLHPFPLDAFHEWRMGLEDLAVVDLTYQGQLHQMMAGLTDMSAARRLSRSGGLPMSLAELAGVLEGKC